MLVPDSVPSVTMDFNDSAVDAEKRMMESLSCVRKARLMELKMEGCPRESSWLSITSGAVFTRDMRSCSPLGLEAQPSTSLISGTPPAGFYFISYLLVSPHITFTQYSSMLVFGR